MKFNEAIQKMMVEARSKQLELETVSIVRITLNCANSENIDFFNNNNNNNNNKSYICIINIYRLTI